MILVIKQDLIDWRTEWLELNDPQDGTDCVTPFDKYLYGQPVQAELVGALEEIQGLTRWLREGGPDHLDLVDLSEALEFATDTAHAALAKHKEQGE